MLSKNKNSILFLLCIVFVTATSVIPQLSHAATINIISADGPGEGFNDTSPFSPIGGNNATTLGQARLNVFKAAANIWGNLLVSNVQINVSASFDSMGGSQYSAILGSAGPTSAIRDFPGALLPNTWYPIALANAIAGSDLNGSTPEIQAVFNSDVDNSSVLGSTDWYYGLDGNPGNDVDLLTVVLHELAHGLGFLSFVNLNTGALPSGLPDAYTFYLEYHGANPPDLISMTNTERLTAIKSAPNLHWTGVNVISEGGNLTSGVGPGGHVEMYAPNPVEPGSSVSHFNTTLFPNELMEPSYTGPNHDVRLTASLLEDIGWMTSANQNQQFTLSVIKSGKGSGTVTSSPPGINCGNDCTEDYQSSISVTLTATPNPGSKFAGWSGDPDCTDGVVSMNVAKTCYAKFKPKRR